MVLGLISALIFSFRAPADSIKFIFRVSSLVTETGSVAWMVSTVVWMCPSELSMTLPLAS